MHGNELKALRKGMALTQEGLGKKIGVSRKTVNELEGSEEVDPRTALAVRAIANQSRLIEDAFWVDNTNHGTYAVVRRTVRQIPRTNTIYSAHSMTILYGEFARREDAYRWSAALRIANNPRNTRKLLRQRAAETEAHDAL